MKSVALIAALLSSSIALADVQKITVACAGEIDASNMLSDPESTGKIVASLTGSFTVLEQAAPSEEPNESWNEYVYEAEMAYSVKLEIKNGEASAVGSSRGLLDKPVSVLSVSKADNSVASFTVSSSDGSYINQASFSIENGVALVNIRAMLDSADTHSGLNGVGLNVRLPCKLTAFTE